ncbi:transposase [Paenibacillus alginolyticus]|uniref:RNA-guided endonuclease InsQ/TnpB family protein n=1 Tax=Paenibacillus alginolyticus TaxID=59839 RepID=UPI0004019EF0|nr:RNA-guided endonuclease TnpB family protein [Paenibacillus alginolyticus]MCY9665850.1 transposase [Paenibacillus alginolyticus]
MQRTYKFRLYPTKEEQENIHFVLECCRLLYNRLLAERIAAYKQSGRSLTYYEQKATLPERKLYIPALKNVHSQVLQNVVERLDKAYQAFFRRVKNAEKAGYPRFKPESQYNSFTYPQSGFSIEGKQLLLSKIGDVRIRLHRQPQGRIKTCTIIVKNDNYYACFSCEVESQRLPVSEKQIGIDLGVSQLAVTSDGDRIESPKFLRKSEDKLKRKQRAVSKKKHGSNRRRKAVRELAKLHEKVANQRRDYAHKESRKLVNEYGLIAFEDLNIQRMVKNHRLAKSIVDAGWSGLVQFVTYKAESAGRQVVQVNPYNTSQQCSNCGEIVKKSLAVRVHQCSCGYVADRDENAAINILKLALQNVS